MQMNALEFRQQRQVVDRLHELHEAQVNIKDYISKLQELEELFVRHIGDLPPSQDTSTEKIS